MSGRATGWAWDIAEQAAENKQAKFKPTSILVLLRLADHANDDDIAWPGKKHLAKICGITKRTADAAIEDLIQRGLIARVRRLNDEGRNMSNTYQLNIRQSDLFGEGANFAPQGAKNDKTRVQKLQGEGATIAPEPTTEPTTEPLTLSASGDAARAVGPNDFYISKRRRKLTGPRLGRFNLFWTTYGYAKGKAETADAWIDLEAGYANGIPERVYQQIIEAARHEAQGRQALLDKGRSPKWPQGWLSGRRWEDHDDQGEAGARTEPQPWHATWPGVLDKAAAHGLNVRFMDADEIMVQLAAKLEAAGERVPERIREAADRAAQEADAA